MPEIKPQTQSEVTFKSKKPFIKIENRTTILIFGIFILLVIAVIFGIIGKSPFKAKTPKETSSEPVIVNPQGVAAFKYYPSGQNAQGLTGPDFRDGSNAVLTVDLQRNVDKVILNWDPKVKASVVTVFDLGKLYDLGDHKKIWQITNYDPKKPTTSETTKNPLLIPPYEVGKVPSGFFVENPNQALQLIKGNRYSVELLAVTEDKLPTLGVHTFTY